MSSGGGSKTQQTTQTSEPWAAQKPYLEQGFARAEQDILNTPTSYYPGSTVNPYSQYTQQGIQGIADRAQQGSPLVGSAQEQLQKTIQGDYLNKGNPYMSGVTESIAGEVMPAVQGQFAAGGRSGFSPLAAGTAAKEMTKAIAPFQFGEYGNERARQVQASGMAPQLAAEDYRDQQALIGAGGMQEAKSQQELQDQMNRFYYEQDEPRNRLEQYMRMVTGGYGGTTSGDQIVPTSNPIMQGLGLGIGAAGAAGSLAPYFGCWVAREVYGVFNPRWLEVRQWVFGSAPEWFRNLYLKHGERFAGWLKDKPRARAVVRWAFDKVA